MDEGGKRDGATDEEGGGGTATEVTAKGKERRKASE